MPFVHKINYKDCNERVVNQMLKKINLILSCLLTLSMLSLGGCGSNSSSSSSSNIGATDTSTNQSTSQNSTTASDNSDNITLTLWHYYNNNNKDAFDVILNEFNSGVGAQNNITVEAYSYSGVSDLASALISSAYKEVGTPDMPNIFSAYTDTTLLLDNLGVVASLDTYFTDDEIALYQQDFLDEGRFDSEGNLKIIPVAKSTEILFINETDFQVFADENDVELSQLQTWQGLAEVAEIYYNWTDAMTEEEYDGSALFGIDSEANFMLVSSKQLGEELYNYDENNISFGLSESSAREIWDYVLVPYIKGYYCAYGSYRSDDIKSGDLLAYTGSTSSLFYFPSQVELGRETAYDIKGTAMPYPYFAGLNKVAVQQGAGMVVSKSDEAIEEAATFFLKWFTSYENNTAFAVSTGYIPVQNESLSLDKVLTEMENTNDDIAEVIYDSTIVIYNDMIPNYEFYSNKPFDGSYDTRAVSASSLVDTISNAEDYLQEQLAEGVRYEEIIETLTNDDAFSTWYNSLKTSINDILGIT